MSQDALTVGQPAPAFSLKTLGDQTVMLSDFRDKQIVLYFYPKDDTPGCTKEACSFRDELSAFTKANAVVLGVSCDSTTSHQRFADKFRLIFPLLSDPGAAVAKAYGVYKQKSMYGRTYWGIERTTFIIDGQGRIAAIFPKVKVEGHTDEVLQAIRNPTARAPAEPPRARSRTATPRVSR